jgi:hypothetical protein
VERCCDATRCLDNSQKQTRQASQQIEAAERAETAAKALSNTDGWVRSAVENPGDRGWR